MNHRSVRYDRPIPHDGPDSGSRIFRLILPGSYVLDVGCSTGFLGRVLKEKNCRCVGIELDPEAAEIAGPHYEKILVGDAALVLPELGNEKFDFIVLADILEHLIHPGELVSKLKPFLAEDGEILASLPNVTHASVVYELLKGRFQYREVGLLDFTHLRFFDRDSAMQLFEKSGYSAIVAEIVTKEPQDTEFACNLSELPSRLLHLLDSNPDSRVYQFIMRVVPSERIYPLAISEELRKKLNASEDTLNAKSLELETLRNKLTRNQHAFGTTISELKSLAEKLVQNEAAAYEYQRLIREAETIRRDVAGYEKEKDRLRLLLARYESWPCRTIQSLWSRLSIGPAGIKKRLERVSVKYLYRFMTSNMRKKYDQKRLIDLIGESGLFDASFYEKQNSDVAKAGVDPLWHFATFGALEGRDPHPLFDTSFYLERNRDVAEAGVNPLAHYLTSGASEGRDPHPLFDSSFYLEQNPDVVKAGINPLAHFIAFGAAEGRDPNTLFDTSYYVERYPDIVETGMNPLVHFIMYGAAEGRDPSHLFQVNPMQYFLQCMTNNPAMYIGLNMTGLPAEDQELNALARKGELASFSYKPTIGILMPTYNIGAQFLSFAIESVLNQTYPHWELYICDDGSANSETIDTLHKYVDQYDRIHLKIHPSNRGISAATNTAMEMADTEYVAMLDNDDELLPDALFEVVKVINNEPDVDVIYTDQDFIDVNGVPSDPFYKPDWSPEMFRGVMYVGHLLVVRRSLAMQIGGFDSAFDKVQDFEFMLRLSESTSRIHHIRKILYHWRRIPGSVAYGGNEKSGIEALQAKAVNAHLQRCSASATAYSNPKFAHRVYLDPHPRKIDPKVTVIMQVDDLDDRLFQELSTFAKHTEYKNIEMVLVCRALHLDQGALSGLDIPIKTVLYDDPGVFNYPHAINIGVSKASGEYVVLLNHNLEPITREWIQILLFYLEQPNVGAVGTLILNFDNTVQHAGLGLGIGGAVGYVMSGMPGSSDGFAGSLSCTREVTALAGDCMMIRRSIYLEHGGLNEYFVDDYQVADLTLRIFTSGKRILLTPRAVMRFREGVEIKHFVNQLDTAVFVDKWLDRIKDGDPYYNPNLNALYARS